MIVVQIAKYWQTGSGCIANVKIADTLHPFHRKTEQFDKQMWLTRSGCTAYVKLLTTEHYQAPEQR